jgi:hypothetical protein
MAYLLGVDTEAAPGRSARLVSSVSICRLAGFADGLGNGAETVTVSAAVSSCIAGRSDDVDAPPSEGWWPSVASCTRFLPGAGVSGGSAPQDVCRASASSSVGAFTSTAASSGDSASSATRGQDCSGGWGSWRWRADVDAVGAVGGVGAAGG